MTDVLYYLKGKQLYDTDFQVKEKFVKDVFHKHNPHFRYRCSRDEDNNDLKLATLDTGIPGAFITPE